MSRIHGWKTEFSEADIREFNKSEVVYLDPEGKYPVPNILRKMDHHFYWQRTPEETKQMLSNHINTGPLVSKGGLQGKIPRKNSAIIFGNGFSNYNIKDKNQKNTLICGVGRSLKSTNKLDLYCCNHPGPGCLDWVNPNRSCLGLFGCGINPLFIRYFRGLKFFYSSGWELKKFSPLLIDLVDPVPTLIQFLIHSGYSEITLINTILYYKEYRPGTTLIGEYFMYPQQLISFSTLKAIIFWLRRGGISIYSKEEDLIPYPVPEYIDSILEESEY